MTASKYPALKKPFGFYRNYLSKVIEVKPLAVNAEDVQPNKFMRIHRADDECLEIYTYSPELQFYEAESTQGTVYWVAAVALLFPHIFIFLSFLLLNFISDLQFLYACTMPDKRIILNRQNGLFSYPGFMWSKPVTIPFKDAVVAINSRAAVSDIHGVKRYTEFVAYHPSGFTSINLGLENEWQTWSRFVWYMDRNRPLPPGTAFDPYRQKDYERRKAEGFPPPLYESKIPTPECEQGQKEKAVQTIIQHLLRFKDLQENP